LAQVGHRFAGIDPQVDLIDGYNVAVLLCQQVLERAARTIAHSALPFFLPWANVLQ
jgi:hypothetical protein